MFVPCGRAIDSIPQLCNAKNSLHWTVPALSTPDQCDRWSDLMPIVTLAIMVSPSPCRTAPFTAGKNLKPKSPTHP